MSCRKESSNLPRKSSPISAWTVWRATSRSRPSTKALALQELAALRLKVRAERSTTILTDVFEQAFALDADPAIPRGSRLQKAVTYLINQRAPLLAHLEHGEVPSQNNDTERDSRHVVVGKKNWQMFGARRGGEIVGRLYSLAICCKLNGIDVQSYLEDVLGLISIETDVAALTP
ncbi:MAG: transposase [Planctomycetota bacterium]